MRRSNYMANSPKGSPSLATKSNSDLRLQCLPNQTLKKEPVKPKSF